MATLTALKALNMNGTLMFPVSGTTLEAANVELHGASGQSWSFDGTFSIEYDYYSYAPMLMSGTLSDAHYSDGTSTVLNITGLSSGALIAYNDVTAQNTQGLFTLLLSGGDRLNGSSAADTLNGYAGADTLKGGAGRDMLTGGGGADRFLFDAKALATSSDTIKDFKETQHDKIVLDNDFFAVGAAGAQLGGRFHASGGMSMTNTVEGDDRILYDTDSGHLYYDPNGGDGGGRVLLATLTGQPVLAREDFTIVE